MATQTDDNIRPLPTVQFSHTPAWQGPCQFWPLRMVTLPGQAVTISIPTPPGSRSLFLFFPLSDPDCDAQYDNLARGVGGMGGTNKAATAIPQLELHEVARHPPLDGRSFPTSTYISTYFIMD